MRKNTCSINHDVRRWLLVVLLLTITAALSEASNALRGGSLEAASTTADDDVRSMWPNHRKLILAQQGNSTTNTWTIMFKGDRGKLLSRILSRRTKIVHEFRRLLNALVVTDLSVDTLNWLLDRDEVLIVEQEQAVHSLEVNVTQTLKDGQPWGIDLSDGTRDGKYSYSWTGQGVNVYVFDTGIQLNHNEFALGQTTRASCGFDVFDEDEPDNGSGSTPLCFDEKGHGTHIAGTVGGVTYGMAKGTNLVAVKVLDANGDGTTTGVIKGLDYVAEQKTSNPNTPMVVSLALGSGVSAAMNEAIDRLSALGVIVVGASGNESVDACTTSPASANTTITVGAIASTLRRPNWSNYGLCVDLHAPGQEILSSYSDPKDKRKTFTRSGTSMAVPHVVGVVAMYLQWNPSLTHRDILDLLRREGTQGAIIGILSSANVLVSSVAIRRRIGLAPAAVPTPAGSPVTAPVPSGRSEPPSMAPSANLTEPGRKCVPLFARCEMEEDSCCLSCREFELFGKRCFLF